MNEFDPLLPLKLGRLDLILNIVLVVALVVITIAMVYGVYLLHKRDKRER